MHTYISTHHRFLLGGCLFGHELRCGRHADSNCAHRSQEITQAPKPQQTQQPAQQQLSDGLPSLADEDSDEPME